MELYNNIRDYRRKAGLTQEQLADLMGVTGASVSKWENGQSVPDLTVLVELADYFGVSVDAMLGHRVREDRLTEMLDRLEMMVKAGEYDQSEELACQILRNYPNHYHAVDRLAHYHYMMYMRTSEKAHMHRAIERTQQLFGLLDGPEDKRRIGLYTSIANQYELLGELDKAVEFYEKGNVDQSNDRSIAHCYVRMGKMDQALPMVSDRFLNHLFQLFQLVMDLTEIWRGKQEQEKALAALEWCCRVTETVTGTRGMMPASLNTVLLLQQAGLYDELENRPAAEEAVRRMVRMLRDAESEQAGYAFLMPTRDLEVVGNLPQRAEQVIAVLQGEGWDYLRRVAMEELAQ